MPKRAVIFFNVVLVWAVLSFLSSWVWGNAGSIVMLSVGVVVWLNFGLLYFDQILGAPWKRKPVTAKKSSR